MENVGDCLLHLMVRNVLTIIFVRSVGSQGLFEALYGKRLLAAIFERGRCYQELFHELYGKDSLTAIFRRHGGSKHCMVRCSWRPCLEDM